MGHVYTWTLEVTEESRHCISFLCSLLTTRKSVSSGQPDSRTYCCKGLGASTPLGLLAAGGCVLFSAIHPYPCPTDYLSLSRWAFLLKQTAPAVNIPDLTLTVMRTSMRSSTVSAEAPPSALRMPSAAVTLVRCLRLPVSSPQTWRAGLLTPRFLLQKGSACQHGGF